MVDEVVLNTTSKGEDWMSPLNKIIWHRAFKARKTQVRLRDGRRFSIDYDQIPGKAWVTIVGGPTHPCGWFDLARVTHDQFLYEAPLRRGTLS